MNPETENIICRLDKIVQDFYAEDSAAIEQYRQQVRPALIKTCDNSEQHRNALNTATDAEIAKLLYKKISTDSTSSTISISQLSTAQQPRPAKQPAKSIKLKHGTRNVLIAGGIVVAMIIIILTAIIQTSGSSHSKDTAKTEVSPTPSPTPQLSAIDVLCRDAMAKSAGMQTASRKDLVKANKDVDDTFLYVTKEKKEYDPPFISGEVRSRDIQGNADVVTLWGTVKYEGTPKGGPVSKEANIMVISPTLGGIFEGNMFHTASHEYKRQTTGNNILGADIAIYVFGPRGEETEKKLAELDTLDANTRIKYNETRCAFAHSLVEKCKIPENEAQCRQSLKTFVDVLENNPPFKGLPLSNNDSASYTSGQLVMRGQTDDQQNYYQNHDNLVASFYGKGLFRNITKVLLPKQLSDYVADKEHQATLSKMPDASNIGFETDTPLLHPAAEEVLGSMGYNISAMGITGKDMIPWPWELFMVTVDKKSNQSQHKKYIPWEEHYAIDRFAVLDMWNESPLLYIVPSGIVNVRPNVRPFERIKDRDAFVGNANNDFRNWIPYDVTNWIARVESINGTDGKIRIPRNNNSKSNLVVDIKGDQIDNMNSISPGDWIQFCALKRTTGYNPKSRTSGFYLELSAMKKLDAVDETQIMSASQPVRQVYGYHFLCQTDGIATKILAMWPKLDNYSPSCTDFYLYLDDFYRF